jgi:hypothetical protein
VIARDRVIAVIARDRVIAVIGRNRTMYTQMALTFETLRIVLSALISRRF